MEQKELSALTDEELLQTAKKQKQASVINAFLIGFLLGIAVFCLVSKRFGFAAILLFFIAYLLTKRSNYNKRELEQLLKDRNLK
jgi:uncharacterized membrane protein